MNKDTALNALPDDESIRAREFEFALSEYKYEQDRAQVAIGDVNQAITIYLTAIGVLGSAAGFVTAAFNVDKLFQWTILSLFCLCGVLASMLALMRTYRSRMLQTDAERAVARLRNYFISQFPDLKNYISGPIFDDWPTPYTHPLKSKTFYGFIILILVGSLFAGSGTFFAMNARSFSQDSGVTGITLSSAVGIVYSLLGLGWLGGRLKARKKAQTVRFPGYSQHYELKAR